MQPKSIPTPQVLPGTMDLMVLSLLQRSSCHAYELAKRLEAVTGHTLKIEEGSLYPCLNRLEKRALLSTAPQRSLSGRKVLTRKITAAGRRELVAQLALWRATVRAVEGVLGLPEPTPQPQPESDDHLSI